MYVDHVTIYGVAGYDRGIQSYKSTLVTITNSIIVEPSDNADYLYPTYCYGGTISNVLSFNTKNHRSGPTFTGMIENTDPLFVDAANGDYTLGEGSPALKAGTDGKNLGDPRWWPYEPAALEMTPNVAWLQWDETEKQWALTLYEYEKIGDDDPNYLLFAYIGGEENVLPTTIDIDPLEEGSFMSFADEFGVEGKSLKLNFTLGEIQTKTVEQAGVKSIHYYVIGKVSGEMVGALGDKMTINATAEDLEFFIDDEPIITVDLEIVPNKGALVWNTEAGQWDLELHEYLDFSDALPQYSFRALVGDDPSVLPTIVTLTDMPDGYGAFVSYSPTIVTYTGQSLLLTFSFNTAEIQSKEIEKDGKKYKLDYILGQVNGSMEDADGNSMTVTMTSDLEFTVNEEEIVPTALDEMLREGKAVKLIENNQVIILRDGKRYNVIGSELK